MEEATQSVVKPKRFPPYNVILLNDDHHTYTYVIRMVRELFHFDETKAAKIAEEVDKTGRSILITTTREKAELKQEQIHDYGADPEINECTGSMTAIIESTE